MHPIISEMQARITIEERHRAAADWRRARTAAGPGWSAHLGTAVTRIGTRLDRRSTRRAVRSSLG